MRTDRFSSQEGSPQELECENAIPWVLASNSLGVQRHEAEAIVDGDRPHSGLNYRTPHEVARTWEDQQPLHKQAA